MKRNDLKYILFIILGVIVIIFLSIYLLFNDSNRSLEKQIIAMKGVPINLNLSKSHAFLNGKDTTYVSSPTIKLIVYVDSTSCTNCLLNHIQDYNEVYDSLKNYSGSLVIVINPGKEMKSEVLSRIKNEKFPFWFIVDEENQFLKNNESIPTNKILQTFLVDSKNRITLVGDPVRNKTIMNLLITFLHEKLVL